MSVPQRRPVRVVELAKFLPLGGRSAGGALSHYQYRSFPVRETNAAMNDPTSVVVMLETVAALEHVEAIIATEGVDMLLVGSNDLCAEMESPANSIIRGCRTRSHARSRQRPGLASMSASAGWHRAMT
jgi:2-keto-3-deoxy-L-rhamnonate aldolase RhmA